MEAPLLYGFLLRIIAFVLLEHRNLKEVSVQSKTVKALADCSLRTGCHCGRHLGPRASRESVLRPPILYRRGALHGFTKATAISINCVTLTMRVSRSTEAEGSASPADVILLVDAARLYKGEVDGLFQPIQSKVLNDAIPANLRSAPQPMAAFRGLACPPAPASSSTTGQDPKADVDTYEELGDPKNKGKLCIRSGSHPYNLSLFGAVTEHLGEQKPKPGSRA